jgi:glycosyltransferase involved in cell wall biosynthesis
LKAKKNISLFHPYLENRIPDIALGLYPKQHLWGIDALKDSKEFNSKFIYTEKFKINSLVERFINKTILKGSMGVKIELSMLIASSKCNFIYSVCGPPTVARFAKNKLISWVFRPPINTDSQWSNSYNLKNLSAHRCFLCLTKNAEQYFSQFAPAKFIPWCVDLDLFDGITLPNHSTKPFFLASGKTGRDYETLVKAANNTNIEIRIIGPSNQRQRDLPPNVNWIDTSSNPPDQAIDYPTLREWYAQCIAVCIPLSGDADDTCGYTNMLEAMAMRKPVIMTKSGCLHINPEMGGFGKQIKPRDAQGWTVAMNQLQKDHEKALEMGNRGREIVERDFTIERFNNDVLRFIETILNKS